MNIHPSKQQLLDYCEGALNDVDGFTIALHLEQCSECRRLVSELEHRCADSVFNAEPVNDPSLVSDESFKNMLSTITDMEPTGASAFITPTRHNATVTTPNGKTFQLPSPLSRHAERISDWKNYGGKVYSASIELDTQARVNLLYINEDAQVPQHTHKGEETTVILHGGFSDEDGHYHAGDYLVRDASHKHAPFTQKGEDCLCLTVLTEPMIFTQGVARIFNLFGKGMYP